jgi:FKBP-type peptidyl-prolyl cis-trans isomerase FklB
MDGFLPLTFIRNAQIPLKQELFCVTVIITFDSNQNMKSLYSTLLLTGLLISPAWAQDAKELKDQKDKMSYAFGTTIANSWKQRDLGLLELNMDLVYKAMRDTMSGSPSLMTPAQVDEAMKVLQTEHRAKFEDKRRQMAEKNKKEGEEFLAQNKSKPGVITLPSGLQYKVVTEGNGASPRTNDIVTANYRGTLIDGTEFDSSYSRNEPGRFSVNGVIKGWTEALQLMKTGSKWQLVIPAQMAYGERGSPPKIGPNATLLFEVELLSIKEATPPPIPQPVTSDIIKVPSAEEMKKGAQIEVIKPDQIEKYQKEEKEKAKK